MIYTASLDTPIGKMAAAASDKGVMFLTFSDSTDYLVNSKVKKAYPGLEVVEKDNKVLSVMRKELDSYFEGKLREFGVPLAYSGSEFRKEIWSYLLEIPYGSTVSYIQVAFSLGRPEAVRAVANANSANPIAIIIPCHRVIGETGSLTGYAGGLWRKQWLLDLEKRFTGQPVDLNLF